MKKETIMRIMNWNIEHMNSWWHGGANDPAIMLDSFTGNNFSPPITDVPALAKRVGNVINSVDPDVVTIQEGAGEPEMKDFFNRFVNSEWKILRGAGKGQSLIIAARLDRSVTSLEQGEESIGGIDLSLPFKADINADLEVDEINFARKPQVARLTVHDRSMIIINNHLKSKFVKNGESLYKAGGADRLQFFGEALKARRRISGEAFRIRTFIDKLLDDNPAERIVVTGDLNDSEGADFFEENFLTHSVVDRVFGSIFRPQKQLTHILFASNSTDFTAKFYDFIKEKEQKLVIDHIGISQEINQNWSWSGRVAVKEYETQIINDHTLQERDQHPSDHRPVVADLSPTNE
jgi:hypothetical protein